MSIQGDVFAIAKVLQAGSDVHNDTPKAKIQMQKAFNQTLTGARSGKLVTTLFFTRSDGVVVPYGSRPPHQASAPGEAPAEDTGKLLRGMAYSGRRIAVGTELETRSTESYSAYLEFGTSKMRPRPYFRSTIKAEAQGKIRRIYKDGIESRERARARSLGGRG